MPTDAEIAAILKEFNHDSLYAVMEIATLRELLLDAFEQACPVTGAVWGDEPFYDNACMQPWEDIQGYLIRHGLIKASECKREPKGDSH